MKICVVNPAKSAYSETFIRAHIDELNAVAVSAGDLDLEAIAEHIAIPAAGLAEALGRRAREHIRIPRKASRLPDWGISDGLAGQR